MTESDNIAPVRAVLVDVGGPIVDEDEDYRIADAHLVGLLRADGIVVTGDELATARTKAIASYCPSYNSATIWHFTAPDLARFRRIRHALTVELRAMRRRPTIRPGAVDMLATLRRRYRVALAGNQPREVRAALETAGILALCDAALLSDDIGIAKPDPRFFLAALAAIDARPDETVMVGDRLDNDIHPANVLRMRTIRFLSGPHAAQEARMPRDLPDATIDRIEDLPAAVDRLSHAGKRYPPPTVREVSDEK